MTSPGIIFFFLRRMWLWMSSDPAGLLPAVKIIPVAEGWSRTSVNTAIFRHNSISSFGNFQYIALYDPDAKSVLAGRYHDSATWEISRPQYGSDVADAHRPISIMTDGDGNPHVSWDRHDSPLRYCRGILPGGIKLGKEIPMTGDREQNVTYPEFYRLPGGGLIFLYRDGSSGNGNLVMNRYDISTGTWSRLHDDLIDGEGSGSDGVITHCA
jgi:hypothetical protein